MSTMPPSRSATHPSMLPPTLPTHGRARGVVFLHAVPRALCPHVEWALSAVVDSEIRQIGRASCRERVFAIV